LLSPNARNERRAEKMGFGERSSPNPIFFDLFSASGRVYREKGFDFNNTLTRHQVDEKTAKFYAL